MSLDHPFKNLIFNPKFTLNRSTVGLPKCSIKLGKPTVVYIYTITQFIKKQDHFSAEFIIFTGSFKTLAHAFKKPFFQHEIPLVIYLLFFLHRP